MEIDWGLVAWGVALFLASATISLVLVVIVLVSLPRTYFLDRPDRQLWVDQHPVVRVFLRVLKNAMGIALVVTGILLSLPGIPGQGILTVLVGIMLVDFPGKQQWQRKLVSRPRVRGGVNRIRRKFGKPPFQLSDDPPAHG